VPRVAVEVDAYRAEGVADLRAVGVRRAVVDPLLAVLPEVRRVVEEVGDRTAADVLRSSSVAWRRRVDSPPSRSTVTD